MNITAKKIITHSIEGFVAFVVFLLILFILPNSGDGKKNEQTAMNFVVHDSAEAWDEFFEANGFDDILTGDLKDEVIDRLDEDTETGSLEEQIEDAVPVVIEYKKSCKVPRYTNVEIEHGEFVWAYEQRDDVEHICNVERRVCKDGVLLGSYTQASCVENIYYDYYTEPVISYNEKIPSERVQPNDPPYEDASFNTDGKRAVNDPADTYRNNNYEDEIRAEANGAGQYDIDGSRCRTPWGERVENRQFVKAYATAFGFSNAPCEVELRYCHDGKLDGSFEYERCAYQDMPWEDFIIKEQDGQSMYEDDSILQYLETLQMSSQK